MIGLSRKDRIAAAILVVLLCAGTTWKIINKIRVKNDIAHAERILAKNDSVFTGLTEEVNYSDSIKYYIGGKLNLNAAGIEQLIALPGIGPALAERIVTFRQQSGGFTDVAELKKVKGIGEKKFKILLPEIIVKQ